MHLRERQVISPRRSTNYHACSFRDFRHSSLLEAGNVRVNKAFRFPDIFQDLFKDCPTLSYHVRNKLTIKGHAERNRTNYSDGGASFPEDNHTFVFQHYTELSKYIEQYRYYHTVGGVCRKTMGDPRELGIEPATSDSTYNCSRRQQQITRDRRMSNSPNYNRFCFSDFPKNKHRRRLFMTWKEYVHCYPNDSNTVGSADSPSAGNMVDSVNASSTASSVDAHSAANTTSLTDMSSSTGSKESLTPMTRSRSCVVLMDNSDSNIGRRRFPSPCLVGLSSDESVALRPTMNNYVASVECSPMIRKPDENDLNSPKQMTDCKGTDQEHLSPPGEGGVDVFEGKWDTNTHTSNSSRLSVCENEQRSQNVDQCPKKTTPVYNTKSEMSSRKALTMIYKKSKRKK
ncbi:uncharacterized protein LOC121368367 isoform X2 [Gigantopelta aegis]|uniref:uncharacterized protein LOC121368367 isoform X2 n=1 Tax=Gigantopelta aegis TaxID=1735272 RepID=UPI001B88750E|nr:uncharacterized protein LOC121368367 isoform X2 [Gigantopelta aegis]